MDRVNAAAALRENTSVKTARSKALTAPKYKPNPIRSRLILSLLQP
jgi:hypothetical protein